MSLLISRTRWLGGVGLIGSVIYFGPFEETRKGIYVAWHYPYREIYKDSLSEKIWRTWVTLLGGVAGFSSIGILGRRYAKSYGIGTIGVSVASVTTSMITAQLCYSQSANIVAFSQSIVKMVSYTVDGMQADLFGRKNTIPVWETDGIDDKSLEKFIQEPIKENSKPVIKNHSIDELEVLISNNLDNLEHRKLHRMKLVEEIQSLRREEDLLRIKKREKESLLKSISSSSTSDMVKTEIAKLDTTIIQIETKKLMLKQKSVLYHGEKLTRICKDELNVSVAKLNELRLLQKELVIQMKNTGTLDSLKIKRELQSIDVEKYRLKQAAKESFGVKISNLGIQAPRWKDNL